jgi:hypothetical protein
VTPKELSDADFVRQVVGGMYTSDIGLHGKRLLAIADRLDAAPVSADKLSPERKARVMEAVENLLSCTSLRLGAKDDYRDRISRLLDGEA